MTKYDFFEELLFGEVLEDEDVDYIQDIIFRAKKQEKWTQTKTYAKNRIVLSGKELILVQAYEDTLRNLLENTAFIAALKHIDKLEAKLYRIRAKYYTGD